jgi:glycosyltransferase involved in cell wall biosynthesis
MSNVKVLFVHSHNLLLPNGGSVVSYRNRRLLELFSDNVINYNLNKGHIKWLSPISTRLNPRDYLTIKGILRKERIKYIFFDSSICGFLIKMIKKFNNTIKIVSFFHNCEAKYVYDQYKIKGFPFYFLYILTSIVERIACLYSDKCIFIAESDREEIIGRYGVSPKYWSILPVMLEDSYVPLINSRGKYLLFFGSAFFANVESAEYLIKEILPNISHEIVIAGEGMDRALVNYKNIKNLHINGYVKDVGELFAGAIAFISPIFSGSGMKVKIAEALMYGKKVICSDSAATGYDKTDSIVICNTKNEYIDAINNLDCENIFYHKSRALFMKKYDMKNMSLYFKNLNEVFS